MEVEPTYTIYVRLPFPRGDFVDPPPTRWNSAKDEQLWKILSGVSKTELDWDELAANFQVTVDFLLQQVKFLTDRHAAQVRAQLRKATTAASSAKNSSAPSPVPGTDTPTLTPTGQYAAEDMRRTTSGGGRVPSAISNRRASPLLGGNAEDAPGSPRVQQLHSGATAARPPAPRTGSAATSTTTSRGGSLRLAAKAGGMTSAGSPTTASQQRRRLQSAPVSTTPPVGEEHDPLSPGSPEPDSDDESESSSESSEDRPAMSRIIKRPPRFGIGQRLKKDTLSRTSEVNEEQEDDEDDETEAAFLPSRASDRSEKGGYFDDPNATIHAHKKTTTFPNAAGKRPSQALLRASQTSDSSASGPSPARLPPRRFKGDQPHQHRPGMPTSSRTADVARRSSQSQAKGKGKAAGAKSGSEGTPSMGSSFSDLDDASVTQSALEEALASKMGGEGTIGSRMSTFGNAIRSRYMPRS